MKRIEETFAYLLSIIIFLAGLILILLSFLPFLSQNDLISNIIRGFGIALCPAGVIGFLYQYYTQKVFVRQLEDSIRANLFIPQELGIKRIYRDRGECDFRFRLMHEAKEIDWLAIAPGFPKPYDTVEECLRLLKKGVNLRFLACNPHKPFSPGVFSLVRRIEAGEPYATESIENSIAKLRQIQEKKKGPGKIEVRVYDIIPAWYINIIDRKIFAEPYFLGSHGSEQRCIFEIEGGKLYESFKRHFETTWKKSTSLEEFIKNYPLPE
jgi:hypothetical protein